MKHIKLFESFCDSLNEATVVDNINDLEKELPKVFNVYDYLIVFNMYGSAFGDRKSVLDEVMKLAPGIDIKKIVMSAGTYASYEKYRSENGYGGERNGTKAKEDWAEMLENNPNQLIQVSIGRDGKEKTYKKIANEITKYLGKLPAAKAVLKQAFSQANDSYDRNLTMDKYYQKLAELWHNSSDVYNAKGRGTFGRNVTDTEIRRYLLSL